MRNLIAFLVKSSSWILAFVLISISFYLVFTQNTYQRSVFLSSSNAVSGEISKVSNKVTSLIHMQKNNELLLSENAKLHEQLEALRSKMAQQFSDSVGMRSFAYDSIQPVQFHFVQANVVNKSFMGVNNFITLDKGSRDGVKPDMGVISETGVVGVVLQTSDRFSVIIPIVNAKFRLSGKLKKSEHSGSIAWNGKALSHAQLGELPKHQPFKVGDTVVTSFSRIFPKGMMIGVVTNKAVSREDNFNTVDVKLSTDFNTLQQVLIIQDRFFEEQNALEQTVNQ